MFELPGVAVAGAELVARVPAAERWAETSVLVAFAFHCNLECTFCMVEDVLNVYEGTSLDAFRRFAERPGAMRGVTRIIFSGGEVTLAKDLLDYVRFARSLPGIEHVRLQTNATRLVDRTFLRALIGAGVDEYFVSIHGHDAATCDAITQRRGSFDDILAGMRAVREAGATLITNTAIASANVATLPEIVATVAPFAPLSMELWNYWPRADEAGDRGHFVRVGETRGPLLRALAACLSHGISPAVKWFPKCLLGPFAKYHDDGQPPSVIPDDYFVREPSYGCIYEGVCEDAAELAEKGTPASGRCAGLSEPYIRRFGWEADLLVPKRRLVSSGGGAGGGAGARAPEPAGARPQMPMPEAARSLVHDAGPRRTDAAELAAWLDHLGFAIGREVAGFTLASAVRSAGGGTSAGGSGGASAGAGASAGGGAGAEMISLAFAGGAGSAVVRVCPRDDGRRAPLRTASFDLFYAAGSGASPDATRALVTAVATAIRAADGGGLSLPRATSSRDTGR